MASLELEVVARDIASAVLKQVGDQLARLEKQGKAAGTALGDAGKKTEDGLNRTGQAASNAAEKLSLSDEAVRELTNRLKQLAAAGAIAQFFRSSIQEAADEQESLRKVAFAVEATGTSFDKVKDKVLAFAAAQQNLTRFSDSETLEALGRMVRVTGNLEQGLSAVTLASDLASASSKPLAETTNMVAMLMNGQSRALMLARREWGGYIGNAKTAQEALDALAKKTAGAATAEESHAKAVAISHNRIKDFQQVIGDTLLPVVEKGYRVLAFFTKGVEELGIYLAASAAEISVLGKTAGEVMMAIFKGQFSALPQIANQGKEQAASILTEFSKMVEEVEARHTSTVKANTNERKQLRARTNEEEIESAKKAAKAKEEGELKFHSMVEDIRAQRLEAAGMEFEAEKARLEEGLRDRMRSIEEESNAGQVSIEESARARGEAVQLYGDQLRVLENQHNATYRAINATVQSVASSMSSSIGKAFADMIVEGKSAEEAFRGIFSSILRTAVETFVQIAVQSAIITGIKAVAGPGSWLLSGIRAQHGAMRVPGPVGAGVPALLHGGEEIVPFGGMSPRTAAAGSGGGGLTINNTFMVSDLNPAERARVVQALTQEIRAGTEAGREFVSESEVLRVRNAGRTS